MLPEWLIYRRKGLQGTFEIRKINNGDVGISSEKDETYGLASWACPEVFLNKKEAIKLINALISYFKIEWKELNNK